MAPPKADAWPAYIFSDPAVQKLDERGRFIICGVCAQYYTMCGGKKPKPIALNGCYRTRAWEVHKERTRAHNIRRASSTSPQLRIAVPTAVGVSQQSLPFPVIHDRQCYVAPRGSSEPPPAPWSPVVPQSYPKQTYRMSQASSPLVFPLVRRRSELRSWGDFDAALCNTRSGYDWHTRPSNQSRYERQAVSRTLPPSSMSRSFGEPMKAPVYAVLDGLR